jgi:hypothetical protein
MMKIFLRAANQEKNASHWELIPPNTLTREGSTIMENKDNAEKSNVEQPSLEKGPAKLVFPPQLNLKS